MKEIYDTKAKLSAADLLTKDGFMQFTQSIMQCAKEELLDFGNIVPKAALIVRKNPDNGVDLEAPGIMFLTVRSKGFNTPKEKEEYANMVRTAAQVTRSVGVIFMSECWLATFENKDAADKSMRNNKSVEEVPGREEVVLFHLEHRALGREKWVATIRNEGGKKLLGDFSKVDSVSTTGRFDGLLPEFNSN